MKGSTLNHIMITSVSFHNSTYYTQVIPTLNQALTIIVGTFYKYLLTDITLLFLVMMYNNGE